MHCPEPESGHKAEIHLNVSHKFWANGEKAESDVLKIKADNACGEINTLPQVRFSHKIDTG